MSKNFSSNYSRYYDLLYQDKGYEAEALYVHQMIRSVNPTAQNLLELGCGTGSHAAYFCRNGLKVTGLERSEQMVSLALEKSIDGFTPLVKDIEAFQLDEKFDVAIALFHVISYLNSNESLIACFESVCRHLNPSGIFIFDTWYSPAVYHQKPVTRVKKMEDEAIEVTRLAQPEMHCNENRVTVNYEIIIRDKNSGLTDFYTEQHPMRHFSIPEIELLAKITGFKVIRAEEFLTGKQPGMDSWGVCFMLQKI